MKTGYKMRKGVKCWPAIRSMRRISKVRLERLQIILGDLKSGLAVQEIAKNRDYKLDAVWHEFYYLKKLGLLDPDFKNPNKSVYVKDIAKEVAKGAKV